jgi:hypothetical protein
MVALHPSILKRNGSEAFDDLKALRAAKSREHAAPTIPLRDVRKKLRI